MKENKTPRSEENAADDDGKKREKRTKGMRGEIAMIILFGILYNT